MRTINLGIGSDLVDEARHGQRRADMVAQWLEQHPDEAKEFWAYIEGVTKNGYNLYPVMQKLIESLGGPPGTESTIRRYIGENLGK